MPQNKFKSKFSVLVFFILIASLKPAYAYIDPGTGSAIISAIIGFSVVAGVTVKSYWYKFKDLFKSEKSYKNKDN